MEKRFVSWGHWGISFWAGSRDDMSARAIAEVSFPVGARGPCDGVLGSPEREGWRAKCSAWMERGELPEGAACPIGSAWLYDPAHPKAQWVEGRGWTSAVRLGTEWVFPTAHQCDADHAHRERPNVGRCAEGSLFRAPSDGRADGPWIYSCAGHAQANPWEKWERIP